MIVYNINLPFAVTTVVIATFKMTNENVLVKQLLKSENQYLCCIDFFLFKSKLSKTKKN